MNIDIVEIQQGDVILITMNIGNIPASEVDALVNRQIQKVKIIFGCPVAILPCREGEEWGVTIIRNPNRPKLKKVA